MPDYTNIAKPTGATYTNLSKPGGRTIRAGMAIGLLIPLTVSRPQITGDSVNIRVLKPTGSSYTNVAKPT